MSDHLLIHEPPFQVLPALVSAVGLYEATILQEIHYLLGRLQSKQEFVALALAGYRNRLVRMNVNVGIIGMATGITTGMYILSCSHHCVLFI